MPLTCLYHKTLPMRVVKDAEVEDLVATGQWFKHPNDVKEKELTHEKPIRRHRKQRRSNGEHSTKEIGS